MDSTINIKGGFETSADPIVKADSWNNSQGRDEVFFLVNVRELFGVDLNYPGIIKVLNNAFAVSKQYVPVASGLTKKSYTIFRMDNDRIKMFFDKSKIVGATRFGKTVKNYYVQYIAESAKNYNWLSIVMKKFYDELYRGMRQLKKDDKTSSETIVMAGMLTFMESFNEVYKSRKNEAKERRESLKAKHQLIREQQKEKKRLRRIKNEALKDLKEE